MHKRLKDTLQSLAKNYKITKLTPVIIITEESYTYRDNPLFLSNLFFFNGTEEDLFNSLNNKNSYLTVFSLSNIAGATFLNKSHILSITSAYLEFFDYLLKNFDSVEQDIDTFRDNLTGALNIESDALLGADISSDIDKDDEDNSEPDIEKVIISSFFNSSELYDRLMNWKIIFNTLFNDFIIDFEVTDSTTKTVSLDKDGNVIITKPVIN